MEVRQPNALHKSKKVKFYLPTECWPALKAKFKEKNLRGLQELFDAAVVGGIVMRRPEAINLVRKYKQKYKDITFDMTRQRFAGTYERQDRMPVFCFMYSHDFKALIDFVAEENIKRQWIFNALFLDSFLHNDEKELYDLIDRHKNLKIGKKKAAISRLTNDKYIVSLSEEDANAILEQMTREYDEKKFGTSIESLISTSEAIKKRIEEKNAEIEEDREFNKKVNSIHSTRAPSIRKLTTPDEDID